MPNSYEATIRAIMEHTGLSRDQVYAKVLKKYKKLMVSVEGAARLVAEEVKVEIDG